MEAIGLVARLDSVTAESLVERLSTSIFDPYVLHVPPGSSLPLSIPHRAALTWIFMYFGAVLLYLTFGTLDHCTIALLRRFRGVRDPLSGKTDVRSEILFSLQSLAWMSALSVPLEVGVQLGYSKVYNVASDYSMAYLVLSPILFVVVSDCAIYWVHRGLHHRSIYRYVHKPHHSYVHTTAFAAFAFHPVDGWLQGITYQIFIYIFPFYSGAHLLSMALVLLWTINIHDRMSLFIPGVNGAAHHTIHHMTFRSNYGQYLTLWDKVFGTFRDPRLWQASGAPALSEKDVYGKHAGSPS
jgi:Delta7-sterol 5-desaturase